MTRKECSGIKQTSSKDQKSHVSIHALVKKNDTVSLFRFLSFEETTVGESNNFSTSRPRTAAPRLPRPEHQPLRIPKTARSDRSRPNSASFVSPDNLKRFAIGVCESPILIKEFKSCINILFQITYSERLSRVFISGDKPAIYIHTRIFLEFVMWNQNWKF